MPAHPGQGAKVVPKKPKPPIPPVPPRPVQEIEYEGDRLYFVSDNARFYIPVEPKTPPRRHGFHVQSGPVLRRIKLTDKVVLVVRGPVAVVDTEASAYKAGKPRTKFILWAAPKAPVAPPRCASRSARR